MSNKEIKNVLRHVFHFYDKHLGDETDMISWEELNEACGEILKLIEQGPILDKIREEIEQHRRKTQSIDPYDLVGDCLDIIDKHKSEGEKELYK